MKNSEDVAKVVAAVLAILVISMALTFWRMSDEQGMHSKQSKSEMQYSNCTKDLLPVPSIACTNHTAYLYIKAPAGACRVATGQEDANILCKYSKKTCVHEIMLPLDRTIKVNVIIEGNGPQKVLKNIVTADTQQCIVTH